MKTKEEARPQRVRNQAAVRVSDLAEPCAPRIASYPRELSDLRPLYEINESCLDLLANAARTDQPGTFSLVDDLRDLLRNMTPETRARAARRALLLVDMQFADGDWWRSLTDHSTRPPPPSAWQGAFPRAGGVQLARATLSLAWHTAHAAPHTASLLGMSTEASAGIRRLPITEIYPLAERRYRHVRPRWEDRPAVWRRLLVSAQSEDLRRARDLSLYGIQLLTADLISPIGRSRSIA